VSTAKTVSVLGAGAWGTGLALVALRAGHRVRQWARDPVQAAAIASQRENRRYLPGIALPAELAVSADFDGSLKSADLVMIATPAQSVRELAGRLAARRAAAGNAWSPVIVASAKGIDARTGRLPAQLLADALPGLKIAALSGPSFASDVAHGLPTAVTIAAENIETAAELSRQLSAGTFRCYASDDLLGVELGGALKNVLAIAVGAARGMKLGASAEAALIARGFAELSRLARALGARPETLTGLSGLGDLVLTCSQAQSRNFSHGVMLGAGGKPEGHPLAEGVFTARIAADIAVRHGVAAPIIASVADVLDRSLSPREAVIRLLERPLKSETE